MSTAFRSSPSTRTDRLPPSTHSACHLPPSLATPTFLTALDLAGIPLHAADREDGHPLVIAGGHAAFNPEPVADFIDAAVLGDGEQAVLQITDIIRLSSAMALPEAAMECLSDSQSQASFTCLRSTRRVPR